MGLINVIYLFFKLLFYINDLNLQKLKRIFSYIRSNNKSFFTFNLIRDIYFSDTCIDLINSPLSSLVGSASRILIYLN